MSNTRIPCEHDSLQLDCSPWAELAGFERPEPQMRLAAATKTGQNPLADRSKSAKAVQKMCQETAKALASSFPGPLLLPFDELNWHPDYPPQSFRSWLNGSHRNKPDAKRKTLYVAAAPTIASGLGTSELGSVEDWRYPATAATEELKNLDPPSADACIEYLGAFYHGLDVKPFPQPLHFIPWTEGKSNGRRGGGRGNSAYHIGLSNNEISTRIRTRVTPDKKFRCQLKLSDLLDAAISMLPHDAYAIILLMDIDTYEDDDDDFCCGLAAGGSRICVVSSARYHPALDAGDEAVDYGHMWPSSHCMRYVDRLNATEGLKPQKYTKPSAKTRQSPLYRAVRASREVGIPSMAEQLGSLWFSRVARTASHELGHCFGIGHCVYYACNMQGSSGMVEDVRQPPYLCPVCLEKVSYAVAREFMGRDRAGQDEYVKERYRAMADFCRGWTQSGLFAAYGAWVEARLEMM